jgi:Rieske Fe-S protein
MCGANVCLDLTHPINANLANVNGARAIDVAGKKLIVIRTSATAFVTLSRVCTHASCGVGYVPSSMDLRCPCHGSRFDLNGSVTNGPALRSLTKFGNQFDEATQTLTILLA